MEPKKAKKAITITIIVAILLIALCLLFLFDVLPPDMSKADKPGETPPGGETPPPPSENPQDDGPSEADLRGCSENIYRPKESSYLDAYVSMNVHADANTRVYLQYRPEKYEGSSDVIMKMENGTVVTALARENGYTLVKAQAGVAGWIESQYLENH
jgi:hypothetical protein